MAENTKINRLIQQYSDKKATGALFLKLANNKLFQVFFVNGDIQFIKYQNLTGVEALKEATTLTATKGQFHNGAVSRSSNDLPPTNELLAMITTNDFDSEGDIDTHSVITAQQREAIENIFMEYIGPMADLILSDEVPKHSQTISLIDALADEIEDMQSQIQFREDVKQALDAL